MNLDNIAVITFQSEKTETKRGEKNGRPWEITEQAGTIETPFMRMGVRIPLARNAAPFKAGVRYAFNPLKILKVSDFGSIQLGRDLQLEALQPAAAKA